MSRRTARQRQGRWVLASNKVPVSDDNSGVVARVLQEPVYGGLLALVDSAVGTNRAEGGGIDAALGSEVTAKSEHVCPGGQAQVFQTAEFAEPDAFGNVTAGVLSDWQRVELVGGSKASVESPGTFRGLGGVLGDVGGHLAVAQFPESPR